MERSDFRMATYCLRALNAGQETLRGRSSHLQLLVFNSSLYISLLLALLSALGVTLAGQWELLFMLPLPTLALLGLTLYLARRHCFLTARVGYLLVSHFTVSYGIILYGEHTNLSLYFLHLALFPFLLFGAREWRWIIVSSTAAFVLFEVMELRLVPIGIHPLKAHTTSILRLVFTLGAFAGITLPAVLLLCQSRQHFRTALKKNRRLAMDEKHAAIARLGASAAHDIKQPLTTLHLTLEHLDSLTTAQAQGPVQVRIEKAYVAIQRIHTIMQKLLVSSHLTPNVPEPLCVKSVAQLIMQRCKLYLHHQGIQLHVKVDLVGSAVIRCQRQHVMDAVDSLIHNALEAMIGSKAPTISLTLRIQDEFFQVEVADTGPGVSEDMTRSLFTPFFTTKAVGAGLGLSLYNARCIARQYGGDLTCASGPGGRFCLSLPLQKVS